MNKPQLALTITGSGHYIEACPDFLTILDNIDLTAVVLIPMHRLETTRKGQ